MTFIEEILNDIRKSSPDWGNTLFLFPSKRPAVHLKKALMTGLQEVVWAPECIAIADFVSKYSRLSLMDNMSLVFELYQSYLDHLKDDQAPLPPPTFYPLGETMLADFSDIDSDLVNARSLFANFRQLKEVEESFGLHDEELEYFRSFWKHFSSHEPKRMQKEFLDLWNMMGELYFDFRTKLQQQGAAYAGLAERNLAEQFEDLSAQFKGKTIAICGFNALTKAEVRLFKELESVAQVRYYFDFDEHYMAPYHEAGHFMRKNLKEFKVESSRLKVQSLESGVPDVRNEKSIANSTGNLESETRNSLRGEKELTITSASGVTGMIQAVYHDLMALPPELMTERTGIILPDENALKAAIEVIPQIPYDLNITMGMPFQSTGIWSLTKVIFNLHNHYKSSSKAFHYRDVLHVLQHPELKYEQSQETRRAQKTIARQNIIYCSVGWLAKQEFPPLFNRMFTALNEANDIFDLVKMIYAELDKKIPHFDTIRSSILVHAFLQINRFKDLYGDYLEELDINELWGLYRKATRSNSIPFEGEPLKGLQLMGMLESRSIDFDHLFVLSVNEGILPKASQHKSLIPYGIRRAFGMNTFKEDDALAAYYFYRTLQRAKTVNLYYNTDSDNDSKGEPSRFILQIKQELPHFSITEKSFGLSSKKVAYDHLSVDKTPNVLHGLEQYEVKENEVERPLSPSAVVTYIKSPIQFYLRYVANFHERDEVLEEMDAITLGNIVHNTLEELYKPHLGLEISEKLVNELIREPLSESLKKHLSEEMNLKEADLMGRNLLLYNVCHKLCSNVMEQDAQTPGLRILELEFDELYYDIEILTSTGLKKLRLKGQFDRLDEVNGERRVVDYKTGKVDLPGSRSNILTTVFDDGKFAAGLQTLFYSLVYLRNRPDDSVAPTIYSLKATEKMVIPVHKTVNLEGLTEYENMLKAKLEEIWDTNQPFAFKDYDAESKYLMMEVL